MINIKIYIISIYQIIYIIKSFIILIFHRTHVSLMASPLKIPSGALPLNPTTFEKVDKNFNCHSYTMRISFQPHRWKSFIRGSLEKMDDYNQNRTVIELSTDSPMNNSYFYSVLELPTTDGKIYDAM